MNSPPPDHLLAALPVTERLLLVEQHGPRVDDHEARIRVLEKSVEGLAVRVGLFSAVGSVVGGGIVAYAITTLGGTP